MKKATRPIKGRFFQRPWGINDKPTEPGMPRRFVWLAVLWGAYFFAVFSFGRHEAWKQQIIWIGGALLGTVTLAILGKRIKVIERETLLIAAFLGWALLGGFHVEYWPDYTYYFRLSIEMLLVVALLGSVLRISGHIAPLWWAFLTVGIYNTLAIAMMGPVVLRGEWGSVERATGLIDNPNGLAFLCFMGILGALGIIGEKKSWKIRAVAAAGAFVAFYGMVAAGSRGAYLSFVIAGALWPVMCLGLWKKRRRARIFAAIAAAAIFYVTLTWIQEGTYLGMRTKMAFTRQDTSSEARLELVLKGLQIAAQNPVTGVGLGQFGLASGSDKYAHNEWAELLATTGVPGFLIFIGVYWSAWRRLGRALRRASDPITQYRINFARMTLIILVVAGAVFRPNFLNVDTIFLLASVVGISWWAEDRTSRILALRASYNASLLSRRFASRAENQACSAKADYSGTESRA